MSTIASGAAEGGPDAADNLKVLHANCHRADPCARTTDKSDCVL